MSVFARLKKAREEKKGFTLVELIVVLVILAILAAILVPALLGWIDKAKEKQYVLDARSVYMAAQALTSEAYASEAIGTGEGQFGSVLLYLQDKKQADQIKKMSDVSDAAVTGVTLQSDDPDATEREHKKYTIVGMVVTVDGVTATLANGTWTISDGCE